MPWHTPSPPSFPFPKTHLQSPKRGSTPGETIFKTNFPNKYECISRNTTHLKASRHLRFKNVTPFVCLFTFRCCFLPPSRLLRCTRAIAEAPHFQNRGKSSEGVRVPLLERDVFQSVHYRKSAYRVPPPSPAPPQCPTPLRRHRQDQNSRTVVSGKADHPTTASGATSCGVRRRIIDLTSLRFPRPFPAARPITDAALCAATYAYYYP